MTAEVTGYGPNL